MTTENSSIQNSEVEEEKTDLHYHLYVLEKLQQGLDKEEIYQASLRLEQQKSLLNP